MPCFTRIRKGVTVVQRQAQVKAAIASLEAQLEAKTVKLKVGPTGALAIDGWKDRDDVTDVCAIRAMMTASSWAFRQALARAEALAGRKMDQKQVAAGVHSHDSGHTWHPGHK